MTKNAGYDQMIEIFVRFCGDKWELKCLLPETTSFTFDAILVLGSGEIGIITEREKFFIECITNLGSSNFWEANEDSIEIEETINFNIRRYDEQHPRNL